MKNDNSSRVGYFSEINFKSESKCEERRGWVCESAGCVRLSVLQVLRFEMKANVLIKNVGNKKHLAFLYLRAKTDF